MNIVVAIKRLRKRSTDKVRTPASELSTRDLAIRVIADAVSK